MNVYITLVFNTVLVHVARTWERLRLEQPNQEMPQDNIQSVDSIVQIADEIMKDVVINNLIMYNYKVDNGLSKTPWDWSTETDGKAYFSDTYIELLATEIIKKDYL